MTVDPVVYDVEIHDVEVISVETKKRGAPRRPMSKELEEKIKGLLINN